MRLVFKIITSLSIISTIILTAIAIVFLQVSNGNGITVDNLNWSLLSVLLPVNALVMLIGGVSVWFLGLNPNTWKTLERLETEEMNLRFENAQVTNLKHKLADLIIKYEAKNIR